MVLGVLQLEYQNYCSWDLPLSYGGVYSTACRVVPCPFCIRAERKLLPSAIGPPHRPGWSGKRVVGDCPAQSLFVPARSGSKSHIRSRRWRKSRAEQFHGVDLEDVSFECLTESTILINRHHFRDGMRFASLEIRLGCINVVATTPSTISKSAPMSLASGV